MAPLNTCNRTDVAVLGEVNGSSTVETQVQQAWIDAESLSERLLKTAAEQSGVDRGYFFHFRGSQMHNTDEYCKPGVLPFKDALSDLPCKNLPYFTDMLKQGRTAIVNDRETLPAAASLEAQEMSREGIRSALLVPVPRIGAKDSRIAGFVGFDACSTLREWTEEDIDSLRKVGTFILALQTMTELVTQRPRLLATGPSCTTVFNARPGFRFDRVAQAYDAIVSAVPESSPLWTVLPADTLRDLVCRFVGFSAPVATPPRPLIAHAPHPTSLSAAARSFNRNRYAILSPTVWEDAGISPAALASFKTLCQKRWHEMKPDIGAYADHRDVGYGRYRYREGCITPLKHKPFFQVKPEYNVILGTQPRPFNRLSADVRHHPVLIKILQTLLEDVWRNELGSEVHIGVHPVRVRNFHEDVLKAVCTPTLEGTHVDSTERVAVMMIERHNVQAGCGKTAIYKDITPMGLRRDKPEDEEILRELRLAEHTLMEPLEAITFDDTAFKHDASDFRADKSDEKAFRCVMLIMARRPLTAAAPYDDREIDGYTPCSAPTTPCSSD